MYKSKECLSYQERQARIIENLERGLRTMYDYYHTLKRLEEDCPSCVKKCDIESIRNIIIFLSEQILIYEEM